MREEKDSWRKNKDVRRCNTKTNETCWRFERLGFLHWNSWKARAGIWEPVSFVFSLFENRNLKLPRWADLGRRHTCICNPPPVHVIWWVSRRWSDVALKKQTNVSLTLINAVCIYTFNIVTNFLSFYRYVFLSPWPQAGGWTSSACRIVRLISTLQTRLTLCF